MSFLTFNLTIVSASESFADLGNRTYTTGTYDIGQEYQIEDIRYSKSLAAAIYAGFATAVDSLGRSIVAQGTLSLTELLLNKAGHAFDTDDLPQGSTNLYYDDTLVGNFISIGPSSSSFLNFNSLTGELDVTALAITTVTTDNVYTSIATWVAGEYTTGTFQESDTIVLANATGGSQIWMNNGNGTLTVSDWIQIESPISITASNGLTASGANTKLGGTLIESTIIEGGINSLSLGTTGSRLSTFNTYAGTSASISTTNASGDNLLSMSAAAVGLQWNNGTISSGINNSSIRSRMSYNNGAGYVNYVEAGTDSVVLRVFDGVNPANFIILNTDIATFTNGIRVGNLTDTTAGNIRWNGTNFQGYDGLVWKNLDAQGTTYIAGEAIEILSDDSINALYDNVTIYVNGVNQLEVKDLGIDTAKLVNDSVDDTKIDWGTGANQVNAEDLPLTTHTWTSIATPANTQLALEYLDAAITGNTLTEGNGINISTGNIISAELDPTGGLYFNATSTAIRVDDSSIEIVDLTGFGNYGLRVKADGIKDSMIDFGTGAGQVNAEDLGLTTHTFVAISTPTDVQDAIEKLDAEIAGRFSWHLGASSNNANVTDRFIEREGSTRTNQSPFVVWYDCTLEAISLSSNAAATWTAHIYKNGSSVATLASGGNQYAQSTGVNVSFTAGDRVSMYVAGTSIDRPSIDALFFRNPA